MILFGEREKKKEMKIYSKQNRKRKERKRKKKRRKRRRKKNLADFPEEDIVQENVLHFEHFSQNHLQEFSKIHIAKHIEYLVFSSL